MVESVGVIPARFASTRFPGKVLASLWGKPLIQHVYERVARCRVLDRVLVATDSDRVVEAVERFGGTAVRTAAAHPTGTDRVAEVAERIPADIYLNIQGDEPLVEPDDLERMVRAFDGRPGLQMVTLRIPLSDPDRIADPNVVKVVTDATGMALLFSRSPIPYRVAGGDPVDGLHQAHVGVYAYRRDSLLDLARRPPGRLEQAERLEQLRALELGIRILTLPATGHPRGIDTPEDLERLARHPPPPQESG